MGPLIQQTATRLILSKQSMPRPPYPMRMGRIKTFKQPGGMLTSMPSRDTDHLLVVMSTMYWLTVKL